MYGVKRYFWFCCVYNYDVSNYISHFGDTSLDVEYEYNLWLVTTIRINFIVTAKAPINSVAANIIIDISETKKTQKYGKPKHSLVETPNFHY